MEAEALRKKVVVDESEIIQSLAKTAIIHKERCQRAADVISEIANALNTAADDRADADTLRRGVRVLLRVLEEAKHLFSDFSKRGVTPNAAHNTALMDLSKRLISSVHTLVLNVTITEGFFDPSAPKKAPEVAAKPRSITSLPASEEPPSSTSKSEVAADNTTDLPKETISSRRATKRDFGKSAPTESKPVAVTSNLASSSGGDESVKDKPSPRRATKRDFGKNDESAKPPAYSTTTTTATTSTSSNQSTPRPTLKTRDLSEIIPPSNPDTKDSKRPDLATVSQRAVVSDRLKKFDATPATKATSLQPPPVQGFGDRLKKFQEISAPVSPISPISPVASFANRASVTSAPLSKRHSFATVDASRSSSKTPVVAPTSTRTVTSSRSNSRDAPIESKTTTSTTSISTATSTASTATTSTTTPSISRGNAAKRYSLALALESTSDKSLLEKPARNVSAPAAAAEKPAAITTGNAAKRYTTALESLGSPVEKTTVIKPKVTSTDVSKRYSVAPESTSKPAVPKPTSEATEEPVSKSKWPKVTTPQLVKGAMRIKTVPASSTRAKKSHHVDPIEEEPISKTVKASHQHEPHHHHHEEAAKHDDKRHEEEEDEEEEARHEENGHKETKHEEVVQTKREEVVEIKHEKETAAIIKEEETIVLKDEEETTVLKDEEETAKKTTLKKKASLSEGEEVKKKKSLKKKNSQGNLDSIASGSSESVEDTTGTALKKKKSTTKSKTGEVVEKKKKKKTTTKKDGEEEEEDDEEQVRDSVDEVHGAEEAKADYHDAKQPISVVAAAE